MRGTRQTIYPPPDPLDTSPICVALGVGIHRSARGALYRFWARDETERILETVGPRLPPEVPVNEHLREQAGEPEFEGSDDED